MAITEELTACVELLARYESSYHVNVPSGQRVRFAISFPRVHFLIESRFHCSYCAITALTPLQGVVRYEDACEAETH